MDSSRRSRVAPYESGVVLPHERTHAGPKEGRLRLLRATRTQVEPIFLLYEGRLEGPAGEPAVDVELEGVRSRLWRVEGDPPAALADSPLLIADGHHRYETALAFHQEDGTEATRLDAGGDRPDPAGRPDDLPHAPDRRPHEAALPPLEPSSNGDDRAVAEVYTRSGSGYLRRRAGRARRRPGRPVRAPTSRYTPSADEAARRGRPR